MGSGKKIIKKNSIHSKTKKKIKTKLSNAEFLTRTISLLREYIPLCGRNKSRLARMAQLSKPTVIRTLNRPDCKDLRDAFYSHPLIDRQAEIWKKTSEEIAAAIPFCTGYFKSLCDITGKPVGTLKRYVRDSRNPHLKKAMHERREETRAESKRLLHRQLMEAIVKFDAQKERIAAHIKLSVPYTGLLLNNPRTPDIRGKYYQVKAAMKIKMAAAKALQKTMLKTIEGGDASPEAYDSEFAIDSKKESFLEHQISFAYSPPAEARHPALIGGFGSGKTMSVPLRWLKLIEYRASQGKKCDLMVLEPTNEMIRDIIVPTFDDFFRRFGLPVKYLSDKQNYTVYYMGGKHTCLLRSADKPRTLTGKNLSDVIIDEFDRIPYYKQKQVWRECISRTRKAEHGTCGVVTTPEGYKLTHELWVEKKKAAFLYIKAKTKNNIYLPPDYIENLYEQYDSRLAKQYLEGEFVNIESDLVYYCFDRNVNVIADAKIPQGEFNRVIISFDFNVNPMCAVEIITRGKARYQVHEYKISNSNTKELCETIIDSVKRRYENSAELNILLAGDASGAARSSSGENSDFEIIKNCFSKAGFLSSYLYPLPSNPPVRERVNFVNAILEKKQFFIAESCIASIKDREIVSWKKGSGKFIIDKSDRETTHLSDAADYGIWVSRYAINSDDKNPVAISIPYRSRYS